MINNSKICKLYITLQKCIIALLCVIFVIINNAKAENVKHDSLKKERHFEISFGQSLLFISNSDVDKIRSEAHVVIPTSSFLFFTELRTDKKIRIPVFFNLPTSSKEFLVNDTLVYEKASPTLGAGLQFKLFQIKIDSKSKIECEVGPLGSVVLDGKKSLFVPIIAGRLRITRGENFIMYLGASYTFGVNTMGLLYGTGSVF